MDRWSGKVAVVTGASSGIGAAIVVELVKYNIQVVGLGRRVHRIEELAKTLTNFPGKVHSIQTDMTKEEDILAAFKWVKSNLGGVDILVNNAGISCPSLLSDGKTEEWRKVFDTNVMGLCIATREAIQSMKERNIDGQIVHMNSICGHQVPTTLGPYANVYIGTKHAITGLTETLRQELVTAKSRIKISSVSPGFVATELVNEELAQAINLKTYLEAKNVAEAVVYIISTPPDVQIVELTIRPVSEVL